MRQSILLRIFRLTIFLSGVGAIAPMPPKVLAGMPFSASQKSDLLERIRVCQEPKFVDGYETAFHKISIFDDGSGSFLYCGYDSSKQRKILLPAAKGQGNDRPLWKAKNGNVEYGIWRRGDADYELLVLENGKILFKNPARSVFSP